ncbi:MAG: hypothetical protein K8L97_03760 [Anaerolineae bacterium]|nr:hypothetical protein [Anaerolineae bacterium]
MKVLVAYATTHGSTAEIAEFMGGVLKERDLDVTVARVGQVQSVQGYDAFVLGSPIYAGMWLTEMSQFLEKFNEELVGKPVHFWIACIRVLEADGLDAAQHEYVHKPTMEKLGVKDLGVFAGKLNLDAIDWNERWTLSARYDGKELPGSHNNDYRDWKAIRAWTTAIRDQLAPA